MSKNRRGRYANAVPLLRMGEHFPAYQRRVAGEVMAVADEELHRAGNWLVIARARARECAEENARLRATIERVRAVLDSADVSDRETGHHMDIRAALEETA